MLAADRRGDTPAPHAAAGTWVIDPTRSVARFSMKYLLFGTLRGTLGPIEGKIVIDGDSESRSIVAASIDVTGLNTGIGLRDRHLRSDDFFDVGLYPTATFAGKRIGTIVDGRFHVVGDLTIRDVTREVTLDTSYQGETAVTDGSRRATFTATTELSRQEFGLGRRVKKSGIASDRVTVTLEITAASGR